MSPNSEQLTGPTSISLVLLAFCAVPIFEISLPESVHGLYRDPTYRVVTGLALAALIAWQWSLAYLRKQAEVPLKRLLLWHRWGGGLAPAFLLAHVISRGYGYLTVLTLVFVADCVLGLLCPHGAGRRLTTWWKFWLPMHISASIALVALLVVHIVVVTTYH